MPRNGRASLMAKVYVVSEPQRIRGIYSSWPECEAAVKGVRGAKFQGVASRELAEAVLRGECVKELSPGLYGFVDGNHLGGVGVVIVEQPADGEAVVHEELGMTVVQVFLGAGVRSFDSPTAIRQALSALRNILAELGGLYLLLRLLAEGAAVTVVHDYEGVAAWMQGRWRTKDKTVREIVDACHAVTRERSLRLTFRHQRGHQSTWLAQDAFAYFNGRVDRLASEAAREG